MNNNFQVAIDGPIGSGKSTVASALAKELGFAYINTGAMYRAASLICLREGWGAKDEEKIVKRLEKTKIEIRNPRQSKNDGRQTTVLLDGKDISAKIMTRKVSELVAKIATLPKIRQILVKKQQVMARKGNVVMEGRDIGTRVLPEAKLKIYLDAREEMRIERRFKEIKRGAPEATREEVAEATNRRDRMDRKRQDSPLRQAEGAWYLDSSELTINEVVKLIVDKIRLMRKK